VLEAERGKLDVFSARGQSGRMTDSNEQQQVLYALFCLSRDTQHIDATTLAAALSLTPTRAASALLALEREGLVDASRARLTMLGLASAVRLGPAKGGPCLTLGAALTPVKRSASRLPIAAKPTDERERAARSAPTAGTEPALQAGRELRV
jgi:hypothetical protein